MDGVLFNKTKTILIQYPTAKTGAYTIPNSVTGISDFAFHTCIGLPSIIIPNSVTSIGSQSFYGCSSLISATIGNSVTVIGYEAFRECSALTFVTIGNSVTNIGESAFRGCSNLSTVNFNAVNCTDMGIEIYHHTNAGVYYSFSGCSKLTTINIGSEVTRIPTYGFSDCSGITEIINHATMPQTIGSGAFNGVNKTTCTLRVPAASVADYQAATGWEDFVHIAAIE